MFLSGETIESCFYSWFVTSFAANVGAAVEQTLDDLDVRPPVPTQNDSAESSPFQIVLWRRAWTAVSTTASSNRENVNSSVVRSTPGHA